MTVPRCSLCMIVRDEADVLVEALASVREVVDEIVVVDTGSVDHTMAVAERQGATVHSWPWSDDFAAARNHCLSLASGDWALVMDGDERLDPGSRLALRDLIRSDQLAAYRFRQHTYLNHANASGLHSCSEAPASYRHWSGYLLARQTRLFPLRPDLTYRGRVHEEITEALAQVGIPQIDTELVLHHVGKVRGEARRAQKQELYRRLGELKLSETGDPRARYEVGVALLEVGDFAGALSQLRAAAEQLDDEAWRARAVASASRAMCALGRMDEALEYLPAHLPTVARVLPVWEAWVDTLCRAGRFDIAVGVLQQALPLFPDELQLWRFLERSYAELCQPELAAKAHARWSALGEGRPDPVAESNSG